MANGRQLTIGDLVYRLGFSNEEEFVASLDKVLGQADKKIHKESEAAGKKGGRAAGKGFSDQFRATFRGAAIGSFIGTALSQAFTGAITHTTKFVADSVREFAVYEQGLLQLKLAGETNLGALSQRIQDTARATRVFSATDVSIAVGSLVKAGFDAETAFALVEAGALGASTEVDALTGKFGDLESTSAQLGNVLRALGLDASQSSRVMDVLARAAQDSNLNVSDLVDIVSRVGPTAKLAGLDIEDLAAAAAVLSNGGMEASQIGTGLRSVLLSLINPTGDLKGELDRLGVSLVDEQGNIRDFGTVLEGLNELTQRGGEGLQILTRATGNFGSTTASVLGASSATVKEFTENMYAAEGAAEELADTMRNSAAGAAAEMQAMLASARAELGEQMVPIMLDLYERILPSLVTELGSFVDLLKALGEMDVPAILAALDPAYEGWADMSTGERVRTVLGGGLAPRLDPEFEANLAGLQERRAAAQAEVERLEQRQASWQYRFLFGLQARAETDRDLAAAREELAEATRLLSAAEADRAGLAGSPPPGVSGGPTEDPQDVAVLTEAYRNLAVVREELAQAEEAFRNAASPEDEAAWSARVRALKAEERALLAQIETREKATAARAAERDAIVDEAQRVQNDLQRLKLAYEQGELPLEDYVAAQEAHLRRLDGLKSRVTNPQQSLAVLRAQKAFLDELARLEQDSAKQMEAIRAVNRNREEEQRYPRTLTGANLRARIRAREREQAEAEAEERRKAWKEVIQPELEKLRAEREAFEAGERPGRPIDSAAVAANIRARQRARDAAAAAEAAEAREPFLEENRRRLAASRAATRQVEAEARRLGIAVTAELRNGTLEGLQELEAELVKLLSELGDDPSAAPLLGLLTQTRSAIANVTEATREQESEQRKLIRAHNEYTESLKRARQAEIDRALGGTTRLVQAQRALGTATREDVRAALEEQISTLDGLIARTAEGTETWYDYVAALEAARSALDALNREVPDFRMPDLGSADAIRRAFTQTESMIASLRERIATETDETVIALLEQRIAQYTALLQQLGIAVAELDQAVKDGATKDELERQAAALANDLMRVAESFPRAIVEGIRTGDIGSALEQALGGAADYFLDMMLKSILGPITEELTAAITKSLTAKAAGDAASGAAGAAGGLGALGPTGFILGGVAILASMLAGASRSRQSAVERNQQTVRAAVSGAPSVTYNLAANVEVNSNAAWSDPAFTARWRSETEALVVSLLSKVRR